MRGTPCRLIDAVAETIISKDPAIFSEHAQGTPCRTGRRQAPGAFKTWIPACRCMGRNIMTRLQTLIATAAVTLLASGSAFAGALQPAAGQAPFMDQMTTTQSVLTRSAVEAQAAAAQPAAGQFNPTAQVAEAAVAQTPSTHANRVASVLMPASGEAPFVS